MPLPTPSADTTALITGASSGIGSDLARELASRGHNVTLVARREDRLRSLADEIAAEHGVSAEVLACDLQDPEARDALPGRVAELGRTVNVLVNTAGYGSAGRFVDLPAGSETGMVRLNCEAVVALTHAWAGEMVQRGDGAILIVASSAGFQPLPRQATYGASKAFALSFSEALHAELRPHGISVTALCPGPVETEFAEAGDIHGFDEVMPKALWVAPREVARQAIAGLSSGKRVVAPGIGTRVMTLAGHYTPRALLLPMMRRFYPL
jgi:short-subunit dehydrogenase